MRRPRIGTRLDIYQVTRLPRRLATQLELSRLGISVPVPTPVDEKFIVHQAYKGGCLLCGPLHRSER